MLIPNSLITIDSEKGHSASRMEPAYYADIYRFIWGRAALKEGSPNVYDLPENAHESTLYHNIDSVNAEWRFLCAKFGAKVIETAFPGGEATLRERIVALLAKDAERTKKLAARKTEKVDPAMLAFGLSETQARYLASKGITADAIGTLDMISLAELPDMTPESAIRLHEKIQAKTAAAKAGIK